MIGIFGVGPCRSDGWETPFGIRARRFNPDILRWENVTTQNTSDNVGEPFALTPAKNACGVSVPQIAATLLDAKLAFPIPAARAWLREERPGVQKLHRLCAALL
jgi:hypothetical protein